LNQDGIRLDTQPLCTLAAGTQLRPLRDQILVKALEWKPSKVIAIAGYQGHTLRGVVVSTGPGCYPKRYNASRSKTWDSKAFRRTETQVGDIVELGGLENKGYDFLRLMIGNELHIMCRDEDVVGIVE
jgi:co-chaperonin GroES (HSP10)